MYSHPKASKFKTEFTMVNTDDFIKRLEEILNFYQLSASAFADQIGVQRSSMSHLLSGRNKPSLDFVLKVCDVFDQVTLPWFLKGEGVFPKNIVNKENVILQKDITKLESVKFQENESNTLFDLRDEDVNAEQIPLKTIVSEEQMAHEKRIENEYFQPSEVTSNASNPMRLMNSERKDEVDFVVVFYKDGSCRYYKNS